MEALVDLAIDNYIIVTIREYYPLFYDPENEMFTNRARKIEASQEMADFINQTLDESGLNGFNKTGIHIYIYIFTNFFKN